MLKVISYLLLIIFLWQSCIAKDIAIIGCGYVGLTMAAVLSDAGHAVTCVDIDHDKINQLTEKKIPLYEPGLKQLLFHGSNGHLTFTTDITQAAHADIFYICVPTPNEQDGSCDTTYLIAAFNSILEHVPTSVYKIINVKSTVSPKIMQRLKQTIEDRHLEHIDLIYNPEFMREGSAIRDIRTKNPVVLASDSKKAISIMQGIYRNMLSDETPVITTNFETAEMIKYAWNSFSAIRITYINELAVLAARLGADIFTVIKGIALSEDLLPTKVLKPGPGYGGSCFPKDTLGFSKILEQHGFSTSMVHQAIASNKQHKALLIKDILKELGPIKSTQVATILGLSFKAGTNDIRQSPAIDIIEALLRHNITIKVYDPKAMDNMRQILPSVAYCPSAYEAVKDSDCIIVLTEWDEIKQLDLEKVALLCNKKCIIDARNLYETAQLKALGFHYINMGKH